MVGVDFVRNRKHVIANSWRIEMREEDERSDVGRPIIIVEGVEE